MGSLSHPTIVFFAGAFADPSCFDRIIPHFQKAGYPTVYVSVPSLNPKNPASASTANDALEARNTTLIPIIENGKKEVIIFAHSYGGVVGGASAAGLSKAERSSRNELGGVVGLVYLAGNIVLEGESLLQAVGGAYPHFIRENYPSPGVAVIDPAIQTLYSDADASLAPSLEAAMIPHSLTAFETPASAPAWAERAFDGRRVYIRTLEDQCNPLFLQDIWIEKTGVPWQIIDLESSHCPFISIPEQLVTKTRAVIDEWY